MNLILKYIFLYEFKYKFYIKNNKIHAIYYYIYNQH